MCTFTLVHPVFLPNCECTCYVKRIDSLRDSHNENHKKGFNKIPVFLGKGGRVFLPVHV